MQYKERTALRVSRQSIQPLQKYGEYAHETRAPNIYYWKPISQYALYSAMFYPLHSNIGKEQDEKHLCNPSNYYGKYGEYTHEMCAPYLDTWKP